MGFKTPQSLFSDPKTPLVADSSVLINLAATGLASEILRRLPFPVLVVREVQDELEEGRKKGRQAASVLDSLIKEGLVKIVDLDDGSRGIFEDLTIGAAVNTLDDGEAATIACAVRRNSCALIDEKKAKKIASDKFPGLQMFHTVELMFSEAVWGGFEADQVRTAVENALQKANMSVPLDWAKRVIDFIGEDAARKSRSLNFYNT